MLTAEGASQSVCVRPGFCIAPRRRSPLPMLHPIAQQEGRPAAGIGAVVRGGRPWRRARAGRSRSAKVTLPELDAEERRGAYRWPYVLRRTCPRRVVSWQRRRDGLERRWRSRWSRDEDDIAYVRRTRAAGAGSRVLSFPKNGLHGRTGAIRSTPSTPARDWLNAGLTWVAEESRVYSLMRVAIRPAHGSNYAPSMLALSGNGAARVLVARNSASGRLLCPPQIGRSASTLRGA